MNNQLALDLCWFVMGFAPIVITIGAVIYCYFAVFRREADQEKEDDRTSRADSPWDDED